MYHNITLTIIGCNPGLLAWRAELSDWDLFSRQEREGWQVFGNQTSLFPSTRRLIWQGPRHFQCITAMTDKVSRIRRFDNLISSFLPP
jgi:hypothetical protein